MYKNANLSSDVRARDLLSKMTLEEKLDQMVFFEKIDNVYDDIKAGKDIPCRCGMWGDLNNSKYDDAVNIVQDYFVNKTRLGIPALIGFEALHGLFYDKATVFPQNAGIGGSFDIELYREMSKIIGEECRAAGVRQVYSPVLDIPRDPRWGRSQESYSEDPYLVGEMGSTYVKGVQKSGIATTLKHFLAYGSPENGLNCATAHVGEREVREVMLEPFKKCIDAGAHCLMPSYNEIDGDPCHSSKKYMRDILRGEMGFGGVTIADWGGVNMINEWHHVAESYYEAGKLCLEAGLDIEEPIPECYSNELCEAIKSGEVDINLVDEAVYRILKMKFDIGLFEDPYSNPENVEKMHSDRAVEISRRVDEESIVLIKNDGILPLDENKISKVAVIGNNAKDSFLGDYIGRTKSCVNFYDGIVNRLGSDKVLFSQGCNPISTTDEMINDAIETAKKAEIVMLVLGDSSPCGGGEFGVGADASKEYTVGEGYDANDLGLSPSQHRLFEEVIKLNKPTILIYYAGRPCAIKDAVDRANGSMLCWGGGEQNGVAIANLIFGDKTPSAKLSFSLPLSVGNIPCYYNHKGARGLYNKPGTPEKPGRDYVLSSPVAWLPFGYGLSYTTVNYSDLRAEVTADKAVTVWVDVENTGSYEINESVLLFVKMLYCPTTPFVKKLRKFKKVNLLPGEKKTVQFTLTDEDFTYIDYNMKTAINKGEHKILIENLECIINR